MSPQRPISHWRRFAIRLVAVCVLGVLVGAGWHVLQPKPARQLTSYGHQVVNADKLLRQAEQAMKAEVTARHGSRAGNARCYYTSPPTAAGLARDADLPVAVGDSMLCGPVLFVDADPSRPFLSYNLTATPADGSAIRLSLSGPSSDTSAADPRPASQLVRPDWAQPPASDRLRQPRPPAAVGDVLTTTATLRTPLTPAPRNSVMIGQLSGARLVEYGYVDSYDWGDRARVAPPGYRLLAFATEAVPGEAGALPPDLMLRVDGIERGPLTATSDYLVTAVPTHARSVDLLLVDSGMTQSISLLTGKPDSANPVVTAREHTSQLVGQTLPVRVRLKTAAGTGTVDGVLSLRAVSLSYWAANGTPCAGADRAWLHVAVTVKLDGDKQPYGVEAPLVSVTVPEIGRQPAHNAAGDPTTEVDDVVAVPAAITAGSVTYSGTVQTVKGTMTVLTPVTVPFAIPAG